MASRNLSILARGFSTATANHAVIRTPVAVHGIDGRYASALYSAASKQKSLEAVEKDLVKFAAVLKTDPRLADFLKDPSIQKSLKLDGLAGAADKMKLNPLSKNLLLTMAENNRFTFIPGVTAVFSTIMSAHRGEVVCTITTAKALDAGMSKEVEASLNGFLKKGEKAQITYLVDPSIIGGMVVSIADKFCDMSMSTKLNKYTELLKAAA
jgi:F-type H+-transporting ATPase subunit O